VYTVYFLILNVSGLTGAIISNQSYKSIFVASKNNTVRFYRLFMIKVKFMTSGGKV